jgi:hypothetical protein
MFGQQDDLFACGAREPHSSTVCSVIGIDDLIIVGIIAAASIAASQVAASEQEGAANDMTKQREQWAMRQQQINWHKNQQDRAAAELSQTPGFRGYRSSSEELQPWADKLAIQNGGDLERAAAARQADATRTNGYIQAGSTLAQGIAGQALRPATGAVAGAGSLSNGFDATGTGIVDRANAYDLSPGVQTQQLAPADPMGGFQLQQSDYDLLNGGGGGGLYSQAGGYNPAQRNRHGFTL